MTSRPYAEVIGDPIAQSKSPLIHGFWLDALGLDGDYRATLVGRDDFDAYFASRRADPAWRGCNVTMPLKLDALFAADEASDRATAAGAANLLVARDGRLIAANTDVGAIRDLIAPLDRAIVTILGNGGLQARDIAEATAMGLEFGLGQPPRTFDHPIEGIGLINATPIGMAGAPPRDFDIARMAQGGWLLELVSAPLPTPLMVRAAAHGLAIIDGLSVLVEQAADSFQLLFEQKAPRELDRELFERLRS